MEIESNDGCVRVCGELRQEETRGGPNGTWTRGRRDVGEIMTRTGMVLVGLDGGGMGGRWAPNWDCLGLPRVEERTDDDTYEAYASILRIPFNSKLTIGLPKIPTIRYLQLLRFDTNYTYDTIRLYDTYDTLTVTVPHDTYKTTRNLRYLRSYDTIIRIRFYTYDHTLIPSYSIQ